MKLRAVGVISKPKKEDVCKVAPGLLDWFRERRIPVLPDRETVSCLASPPAGLDPSRRNGIPREEIPSQVDLLVVLGGDGTLLATARLMQEHNVPILAVNLGSLGFLTDVRLEEMYTALEDVLADRHQFDIRAMLEAQVSRAGRVVARYRALNDVVLHKAALARIVDFDVTIAGLFVSRIRADGLILSTPTGSTAYSLSAGGPIVHPSVDAMIITPIAPHMLTNRPVVVPGRSRIEVEIRDPGEEVYVTVDGQVGEAIGGSDRISISQSEQRIRLVASPKRNYFEVLRNKLHWGER